MSVKLYYFDGTGRAEPIRWILALGKIPFEDIRAPYGMPAVIPPEIKAKCRWGTVPIVEVDGKIICQSLAIGRYFANQVGLIPSDPYQAALNDEYMGAIMDIHEALWPVIFIQDEKEKAEKLEATIKKVKTQFLDVLDSLIKANGGKHLLGDKLTLADIYLAQAIDQFQILIGRDLAKECGNENIKALQEEVMNTPEIKAVVDKRGKTMF